mmetsp:Transcript_19365/g.48722  ORF Transcript_19365/g.48722 Transcript_19365/m.48722 type:complete len:212 (+) Transcript_19365:889-1524(+)
MVSAWQCTVRRASLAHPASVRTPREMCCRMKSSAVRLLWCSSARWQPTWRCPSHLYSTCCAHPSASSSHLARSSHGCGIAWRQPGCWVLPWPFPFCSLARRRRYLPSRAPLASAWHATCCLSASTAASGTRAFWPIRKQRNWRQMPQRPSAIRCWIPGRDHRSRRNFWRQSPPSLCSLLVSPLACLHCGWHCPGRDMAVTHASRISGPAWL